MKMRYSSAVEVNFEFGFNDIDFSDQVLRLEITPLASHKNHGREKYQNWFSLIDQAKDSDHRTDFIVKTLHISSLLLAAKSLFFYKLFKNARRESPKSNVVTLRINASEEAALMDIINFMYEYTLSATSALDLVDVLMAAEKFEVTSCMRYCVDLLFKLPMTIECALLYLELPTSVFVDEVVQLLIEAAKKCTAEHYKDLTMFEEELMELLPLSAIEVVLGSDGLRAYSEHDVLDFILEWAHIHYTELNERREILTNLIAGFICLPNLSTLRLKEVVDCPHFDYKIASKLVLNALFSKDEDLTTTKHDFPRRVYIHRLVKVFRLEFAQPRCVVYFDLTKEECTNLFPSAQLYSQVFCLGERYFYLSAQCSNDQPSLFHHFGVHVNKTKGSETCKLDFEIAVMKKPLNEFQRQLKCNKCSLVEEGKGDHDLFGTPWAMFICDNSEYFIDEILHLRVELTMIE